MDLTPSRDQQVRILQQAAETLRHLLPHRILADVPHEFVFMSVAHLLEELSRSLAAGHEPGEHTVDAALEIARHVEHRHPRQEPLGPVGPVGPR